MAMKTFGSKWGNASVGGNTSFTEGRQAQSKHSTEI